jgi:hypothetical protein
LVQTQTLNGVQQTRLTFGVTVSAPQTSPDGYTVKVYDSVGNVGQNSFSLSHFSAGVGGGLGTSPVSYMFNVSLNGTPGRWKLLTI